MECVEEVSMRHSEQVPKKVSQIMLLKLYMLFARFCRGPKCLTLDVNVLFRNYITYLDFSLNDICLENTFFIIYWSEQV